MLSRIAITLLASLALASLPSAFAGQGGSHAGGGSMQHMSPSGMTNANSAAVGQEKGTVRADERKSDQGLMHDHDGKKTKAGKSKDHHK